MLWPPETEWELGDPRPHWSRHVVVGQGLSLPYRPLHSATHDTAADFPQREWYESSRERMQDGSHDVFYNLMPEEAHHHYFCILWPCHYVGGDCARVWIPRGRGALWVILEAAYHTFFWGAKCHAVYNLHTWAKKKEIDETNLVKFRLSPWEWQDGWLAQESSRSQLLSFLPSLLTCLHHQCLPCTQHTALSQLGTCSCTQGAGNRVSSPAP